MERYNPFASEPPVAEDRASATQVAPPEQPDREPAAARQRAATLSSSPSSSSLSPPPPPLSAAPLGSLPAAKRYTTSFPDPFGDAPTATDAEPGPERTSHQPGASSTPSRPVDYEPGGAALAANGSSSATRATHYQRPAMQRTQTTASGGASRTQGGGGFTSFLSRATSVTSSSVTDRVSGAVGTVRNAVDSISSQIQQAVPGGLVAGSGEAPGEAQSTQQPSTGGAGYLAARLSSAGGLATSGRGEQPAGQPMISRQRVVLVLDSRASTDWAQQFHAYRRLVSGASPSTSGAGNAISSASSSLTSFFASQFGQLAASASTQAGCEGPDLIEQVNFREASALANQASCIAAVYASNCTNAGSSISGGSAASQLLFKSSSSSTSASVGLVSPGSPNATATAAAGNFKIIRPEFVIVRERCKDRSLEHLRGLVKALSYSMVPMFEPYDIWDTFQDKQLIFARLVRVRTKLGKENFPLIPQIYCQTAQDLLNYIGSSQIALPCLLRTGPRGKGKIKIDSIQMLRDFASIMATSNQSCTIEQFLEVKCDLVVQRLGTSLKLFRRVVQRPPTVASESGAHSANLGGGGGGSSFQFGDESFGGLTRGQNYEPQRQPATRQTSLGASVGVLSNLIGGSAQQAPGSPSERRRSSGLANQPGAAYERLSEVGARYRNWVEAVSREFDGKLEALCIRIVVATNDREYIVGLRNCSMDFLGNQENQDEDRRSFVELVLTRMNTILPKHSPLSRESSATMTASPANRLPPLDKQHSASWVARRTSSGEDNSQPAALKQQKSLANSSPVIQAKLASERPPLAAAVKGRFMSQSDLNSAEDYAASSATAAAATSPPSHTYGQLNNRSKSVSINQTGDSFGSTTTPPVGQFQTGDKLFNYATSSAREPDLRLASNGDQPSAASNQTHQRQASLGQSFLDQTTTAFSSFQRQSLSFLKRLDSTRSDQATGGANPAFERDYKSSGSLAYASGGGAASSAKTNPGTKSQSMDSSTLDYLGRSPRRESPPKPPPPHSFVNRQSSLAAYSSGQQRGAGAKRLSDATSTPATTPAASRQNSSALANSGSTGEQSDQSPATSSASRTRVVRQNSALSAFEPFDPDLKVSLREVLADSQQPSAQQSSLKGRLSGGNLDTGSITSGDSASTNETTTAEDTMNNLKKTFASIFGDKCD